MAIIRCTRGHFYDNQKYAECPHCRIMGITPQDMAESLHEDRTVALHLPEDPGDKTVSFHQEDDILDRTVGAFAPRNGLERELPVGWLVCTAGPERGRDYRLRAGRNFIGRSLGMDVSLSADKDVHRENHASLVFDPQGQSFSLVPGDGTLTYLNGESVTGPTPLKDYDLLRFGRTTLVFRSFCGEGFQW